MKRRKRKNCLTCRTIAQNEAQVVDEGLCQVTAGFAIVHHVKKVVDEIASSDANEVVACLVEPVDHVVGKSRVQPKDQRRAQADEEMVWQAA